MTTATQVNGNAIREHNPDTCGLFIDSTCERCLAAQLRLELLRNPTEAAAIRFEQLRRQCPAL
jgi:hypothetical protein